LKNACSKSKIRKIRFRHNVFNVGRERWVLPFDITVALLVVFQVARLSAAVRKLAARA